MRDKKEKKNERKDARLVKGHRAMMALRNERTSSAMRLSRRVFKERKLQKPVSSASRPHPQQPLAYMRGGRRHLGGISYVFPKDHLEHDRLNFQHYFLHELLGAHYLAPIKADLASIFDAGSGTGRWAHDMAHAFPPVRVVGMDIEAPAPPALALPANYQFVQGNLLDPLPFPDHSFDFVHQRLLVAALPAAQWPLVLAELVRVTHSGGYVELLEAGDTFLHAGPATHQFMQWWLEAGRKTGFDTSLTAHLDALLHQAGLQGIQQHTFQVPLGKWGGRAGTLLATDLLAIFAGLKNFYVHQLSLSADQFETTLHALPAEWEAQHTQFHFYVAYGQRV